MTKTTTKKMQSGMTGHPVDFIRKMDKDKELLFRYYYWDSRLWRAIRKYIEKSDIPCVLLSTQPRKGYKIDYHRGTGSAITWKGAHGYHPDYEKKPPEPASVFNISFEIEWINQKDEEDTRFGNYSINVPIELEDNSKSDAEFQKLFDKWIGELTAKTEKKEREDDLPLLRSLIEKYPLETQAIVGKSGKGLARLIKALEVEA